MMGVFAFPLLVAAQQGDGVSCGAGEAALYSDPGDNFFSNVPINELSVKAYRRFHRRFHEVTSAEYWFKSAQGYKVSFTEDEHHHFAYFDPGGTFQYSLAYYDGKEVPRETGEFVNRRFPDYKIDVVTEVNDGQRTYYLVQIKNPRYIKVLTVADGRLDIIKELNNGGAEIGPAAAAR
jgi:hypothetical protein